MKKALIAMVLVVLAGMGSSANGQMAVSHDPTATPAAPRCRRGDGSLRRSRWPG